MKIIDLLNRIANGEDVPKKIRLVTPVLRNQVILVYNEKYKAYFDKNHNPISHHLSDNLTNLNDEIIEIEDEIDIQNIEEIHIGYQTEIINKLIQAVKQLDKKIKEK